MKRLLLLFIIFLPLALSAQERSLGGKRRPLQKTAHVLIKIKSEDGTSTCSGSLISKLHVLTAGHCVLSPTGEESPTANRYRLKIKGRKFTVSEIAAHPDYDPDAEIGDGSSKFDIGILTLSKEAKHVRPLKLESENPVTIGDRLFFFGYGTDKGGTQNAIQRAARGRVQVNRLADGVIGAIRTEGLATSCPGDSGGALKRKGRRGAIVGVVSAGSTGSEDGKCVSNADPDDDAFVDIQSMTSKEFINSFLNN